jgi:hypothetical protein
MRGLPRNFRVCLYCCDSLSTACIGSFSPYRGYLSKKKDFFLELEFDFAELFSIITTPLRVKVGIIR